MRTVNIVNDVWQNSRIVIPKGSTVNVIKTHSKGLVVAYHGSAWYLQDCDWKAVEKKKKKA